MGRWSLTCLIGMTLLAACTPAPTPFPVQPIVTTEAPNATQALDEFTAEPTLLLRYGVLPNAADYAPLDDLRTDSVEVSVVSPGESQASYDALLGYGIYENWQIVDENKPPVSLILDTSRPPLNNPAIRDAIVNAIRVSDVLTTLAIPGAEVIQRQSMDVTAARTELANAGYPSGITLYGWTIAAPGVDLIVEQLSAANIKLITVSPGTAGAHLIIGQIAPEGTQETIPLYTLPLSYTVGENVSTAFTDEGWLIIAPR